jgi:hypothetical protein
VVITSHKPAIAKDDSALKPYFKALAVRPYLSRMDDIMLMKNDSHAMNA